MANKKIKKLENYTKTLEFAMSNFADRISMFFHAPDKEAKEHTHPIFTNLLEDIEHARLTLHHKDENVTPSNAQCPMTHPSEDCLVNCCFTVGPLVENP